MGLGLFGKFGLLTSGVYIVGRGRAIVGWSEGGKPDDRSHAQVCSGRGGAVVSGEGSITCESSGYWYALPYERSWRRLCFLGLLLHCVCSAYREFVDGLVYTLCPFLGTSVILELVKSF